MGAAWARAAGGPLVQAGGLVRTLAERRVRQQRGTPDCLHPCAGSRQKCVIYGSKTSPRSLSGRGSSCPPTQCHTGARPLGRARTRVVAVGEDGGGAARGGDEGGRLPERLVQVALQVDGGVKQGGRLADLAVGKVGDDLGDELDDLWGPGAGAEGEQLSVLGPSWVTWAQAGTGRGTRPGARRA